MNKSKEKTNLKCGIIMPISAIDNCSTEHWAEVLELLKETIVKSGFEPNLVSDADESGIIQKRIIHNLYSNDIVVCDVSGKNPNVMFELGMRLAFDKPTIIIKDDKTDFSFDTSVIEHLYYPRDLRFSKIISFKELLTKKIQATHKKATEDKNYTTFLKHFGEYKIASLSEKEITSDKFILNAIDEIKNELYIIKRNQNISKSTHFSNSNRLASVLTYEEKKYLVGEYISKYKDDVNLTDNDLAFNKKNKNGLFMYLERIKEVRDACGTAQKIKKIIDDIVDPF